MDIAETIHEYIGNWSEELRFYSSLLNRITAICIPRIAPVTLYVTYGKDKIVVEKNTPYTGSFITQEFDYEDPDFLKKMMEHIDYMTGANL